MNDKLREALETIKDGLTWGQDSDVLIGIAEKALAASKQEPQAQAGPEVVAEVYSISAQNKTEDAYATVRVLCSAGKGYWDLPIRATDKLITLQSHREAMAKTQAACLESVAAVRIAFDEHIAKKDAALKACVEAHGRLKAAKQRLHDAEAAGSVTSQERDECGRAMLAISGAETALDAAITQAKEARK